MANVWAIKNGDWSDPTLWNTGALPTSSDDVYANNFNININQNTTVNSLRNTVNTGITAGGTFTFNTGGVTANINDNIYMNTTVTTSFILVTATAGIVTLNMLNAVINQVTTTGSILINHSGNCNLIITCISIVGHTTYLNTASYIVNKTSLGDLTINGNIYGRFTNSGSAVGSVYLSSNSNTLINGNIYGGNGNAGAQTIICTAGNVLINGNVYGMQSNVGLFATISFSSNGNLNVTGEIKGLIGRAIYISSGNLNVTGTIHGSNSNGVPSVEITGAATLNHIGAAQASDSSSAIVCSTPTQSTIISTGPFLKNGYIVAIASQTLRINFNSNSYFQFKKSNGDDIDYVSTIEGYNYPTPADVRYGVSYKSGLAVGTCHVPTPDNVRKNIPVDNTVGTSDNVNAEDILEAIQNSNLPIATRLRNVATVESTGAQLEAYQ